METSANTRYIALCEISNQNFVTLWGLFLVYVSVACHCFSASFDHMNQYFIDLQYRTNYVAVNMKFFVGI